MYRRSRVEDGNNTGNNTTININVIIIPTNARII